jgi:hypothetical protein
MKSETVGIGLASIFKILETGKRFAGMKEWSISYRHTLPTVKLWVPDSLETELFIDMMRDVQVSTLD